MMTKKKHMVVTKKKNIENKASMSASEHANARQHYRIIVQANRGDRVNPKGAIGLVCALHT